MQGTGTAWIIPTEIAMSKIGGGHEQQNKKSVNKTSNRTKASMSNNMTTRIWIYNASVNN